ncbi:tRNA-dependent cyclodipeptide synthase [Streptomyces sp. NBC_00161]|uniref:tRNA-dependent cyclodipeptide synthase n=2 Tax=unclassified Streptomyces TaxID=2593676 RepID=UPI00324D5758
MTITVDASFEVLPFTRTCRHIWEDGDHVLIGVSPGNSYFGAERIGSLAGWAVTRRSVPRKRSRRCGGAFSRAWRSQGIPMQKSA